MEEEGLYTSAVLKSISSQSYIKSTSQTLSWRIQALRKFLVVHS